MFSWSWSWTGCSRAYLPIPAPAETESGIFFTAFCTLMVRAANLQLISPHLFRMAASARSSTPKTSSLLSGSCLIALWKRHAPLLVSLVFTQRFWTDNHRNGFQNAAFLRHGSSSTWTMSRRAAPTGMEGYQPPSSATKEIGCSHRWFVGSPRDTSTSWRWMGWPPP